MNRLAKTLLLLMVFSALFCFGGTTFAQTDTNQMADSIMTGAQTDTSQAMDSSTTSAQTEESVYPLSPERKAKLISYSHFKNIWQFIDFFVSIILLGLILFTGLSAKLRTLAQKIRPKFFAWWLYFILFLIVMFVISFPFDIYRNYFVELDYGFMNQTFGEWFLDDLKSLLITAIIGIIPFWFVYFVIAKTKEWWLWFGIGSIPLLTFLIVISPVFIAPMFNKFTPLKNKELESKILALASKAGIEGSKVFEVDASKQSSKVNAYVTGLFNTKRIILYDTIVNNFDDDEILFVMGHEMGHYVLNHVWYGLAMAIVLVLVLLWLIDLLIHKIINRFQNKFGFSSLSDIASFPLLILLLTVISFVAQPISNGVSRMVEHQADVFGMEITDVSGDTAAIAFDKLSAYNLSDPDPSPIVEFWFYNHPSLKKRMEFVRNFRNQKN